VVGGIAGAAVLALWPRPARGGSSLPTRSPTVLALAVLGVIVAPAIPLQVVAGFAAGAASASFWTRLQAAILGLRPGQAGTTAAVVGYLALPQDLVPLIAAAAADRAGLGTALLVYLVVAVALALLTAAAARRGSLDQRVAMVASGSSVT
jgi:hypothetical protein